MRWHNRSRGAPERGTGMQEGSLRATDEQHVSKEDKRSSSKKNQQHHISDTHQKRAKIALQSVTEEPQKGQQKSSSDEKQHPACLVATKTGCRLKKNSIS